MIQNLKFLSRINGTAKELTYNYIESHKYSGGVSIKSVRFEFGIREKGFGFCWEPTSTKEPSGFILLDGEFDVEILTYTDQQTLTINIYPGDFSEQYYHNFVIKLG